MKVKDRLEVERVENGYAVTIYSKDDDEEEYGYVEPDKYVAKDIDEVMKIMKENFKESK